MIKEFTALMNALKQESCLNKKSKFLKEKKKIKLY